MKKHGEGLQILHFEVGKQYITHYDFDITGYDTGNGGQVMATVVMYL